MVSLIIMNFFKRVITNPLRYYTRMSGITFCLVGLGNLGTTLADYNGNHHEFSSKKLLAEEPQFYFGLLTLKSVYFGLIWPAFYLTALKNPNNAFILGNSLKTY